MRAALASLASVVGSFAGSCVGLALVAATTPACSSSTETKFTSIEPNTGTFAGGEEIVLHGANFPRGGVVVRFGLKTAEPVVVESDRAIKVISPQGDKNTNTDVTLIFDDGRALQLKSGFRYIDSTQQRNTMDKFFNKAGGQK